ncbi:alcohol dehydrogenase AdhP [Rothia aerolata]|uniref:Alcohol dehydrogenase n=1 Tax=Rothia aerolata TaxID=1812262 RepID=A0A917IWD0_9MICC|nr:alcohol dehydrogenase AdhP [Rothia aerolata]GGH66597.1 zinc-dependent alcohol dehydrogenase [Rothia aerolata]
MTTTLPEKFTAAVVDEFAQPLNVRELDLPKPGPHQVLVKLLASGVCHTDLHASEGDWPVKPQPPFVPGHEGVGEVVALGEGDLAGVQLGDMLGNAWLWSACGQCEFCLTGRETLCLESQYGGYTQNGSFGQYMLVDARYAPRIPKGVDPVEIAPILCAGVTVYKALKNSEVKPGQWVVISGIGGLGHIAVQYAVAMGMRVAAVDIADDKLELARRLGAEVTVNMKDESDPIAKVVELTDGGAHGSVITAVHPSAFEQAIGVSRRGGTIVFVGLPPQDFPASIFNIVFNSLTIRGSLVGTRQDMAEAIDFYVQGKVKPNVEAARLEDINKVFERMHRGAIDGRISIDYRQ